MKHGQKWTKNICVGPLGSLDTSGYLSVWEAFIEHYAVYVLFCHLDKRICHCHWPNWAVKVGDRWLTWGGVGLDRWWWVGMAGRVAAGVLRRLVLSPMHKIRMVTTVSAHSPIWSHVPRKGGLWHVFIRVAAGVISISDRFYFISKPFLYQFGHF